MKKIALIAFLISLFSVFVFAQTNKKAEIKRIDAYVKTIDAFVDKYNDRHTVFAEVSDSNQRKPKWKKYNSLKEFEKARETVKSDNVAYIWRKNGKIVMTQFVLSSGSGDWVKFVYLCFREDGTLAKMDSQLNTFHGDFSLLQEIYFDRKGKILKRSSQYLDLETEKPITPRKDDILDNGDNIKAFYYTRTTKLPFASLLKKR